jgi:hypothetical protein
LIIFEKDLALRPGGPGPPSSYLCFPT